MPQQSFANSIFLVDFDHTLFDMAKLKEYLSGQLLHIFGSQYLVNDFWLLDKTLRRQPHYLTKIMQTFCEQHHIIDKREAIQNAFLHVDFPLFVFPGAVDFLRKLHQFGTPYIFSEGDELYQQVKVHKSGLSRYVSDTLIFDHKIVNLPKLAKSFPDSQFWLIDNQMSHLKQAIDLLPTIRTILINHYGFNPDSMHSPTFKSSNFADIISFLQLETSQ